MSKLTWDKTGEHFYETGVSQGVLYKFAEGKYASGVAWNGLSAVNETPSGGEANAVYADNIKYLSLISAEDYGFTIEAYTYPDEFEECDGSAELIEGVTIGQQNRSLFGFCYSTVVGNDTDGNDYGRKIHIIYGCMASPTEKQHNTINDSLEATVLSWDVTTTPVEVKGKKPTACVTIDCGKLDSGKLAKLENKLYGDESNEPTLPMPDEIITLLQGE